MRQTVQVDGAAASTAWVGELPPPSPETTLAILRSAGSGRPDPRLEDVLGAFRREWAAIARKRYPNLGDDLDDVLQNAQMKLVDPHRLEGLHDTAMLASWARSVFVNTALDLLRHRRLERQARHYPSIPGTDPEDVLRSLPSVAPTPEDEAASRERLGIVAQCVSRLQVAKMRFLEDLPEREIAERQNLSRDAVAGQLKRFRKALREALADGE